MVEQALDPAPPRRAIGAVGQDRCVLDRDADLVVEAVGDPAAHLERLQLAAVQAAVERVVDVVARLLARAAWPRTPPRSTAAATSVLGRRPCSYVIHSSISMPSCATSMPWRCSSRRCTLSSSRIGLLLLMWISTLRARRQRRERVDHAAAGRFAAGGRARRRVFATRPARASRRRSRRCRRPSRRSAPAIASHARARRSARGPGA